MLSLFDIVVFAIGAIFLGIWLIFFFTGLKYAQLFDGLDENEYPFKEIYFLGYAIMEAIHYQYKSKHDRKLRKELGVLYGDKYAEYYIRVIYAQKVTLSFTVLLLAAPLYGFANDILASLVVVMFAGLAFYYFGTLTETKIMKRSEELLMDFSNVVSKLALLTNAGMIMREAWSEVAYTNSDKTLYKEMQTACVDMNNGISEAEAVRLFGVRCVIPEIKKFASTIIQGIEKGNSELAMMLQVQSGEVWMMKQQMVRRKGAQANTKLMIPMFIMFIGILIMIVVPVFTNLGV
jgi:tight adherence protein C